MKAKAAFLHAVAAHAGEDDKVGEPAIFHPLAVAEGVKDLGEDFEVVGLLHDVWEDTNYRLPLPGQEGGLTPRQFEALFAMTRMKEDVQPEILALARARGIPVPETYFGYVRRLMEDFVARVNKIVDVKKNLSPERTDNLPAEEAASLAVRHRKALRILEGFE